MYVFVSTFVAVVLITTVECYPSSGGDEACIKSAMEPHHGAEGQTDPSPYEITLSATKYQPNGSLTVTLTGSASFKGFLVLALPENDATGSAVGTFIVTNNGSVLSQPLCTGGSTHTSTFSGANPIKNLIELTWNAPASAADNITFYATFVKEKSVYWVKVPSDLVTVSTVAGNNTVTTAGNGAIVSSTSQATSDPSDTINVGSQNSALAIILLDVLFWMTLMMSR